MQDGLPGSVAFVGAGKENEHAADSQRESVLRKSDELLHKAMLMGAETAVELNAERVSCLLHSLRLSAVLDMQAHCTALRTQAAVEEALALRLSVLHPLSMKVNEAVKAALQVDNHLFLFVVPGCHFCCLQLHCRQRLRWETSEQHAPMRQRE